MKVKEFISEFLETIVTSIIVILLIYVSVASIETVSGASMEPYYHTNEKVLVDKITKKYKVFERGEVVIFYPPESSKHYIKRIIGVPGDVIKVFNCKVYISRDGKRFILEEGYLADDTCTKGGTSIKEGRSIRIEVGKYAVFGDNRGFSLDSRSFGFIDKKDIIGRVVFRFWPLNKLGFVN